MESELCIAGAFECRFHDINDPRGEELLHFGGGRERRRQQHELVALDGVVVDRVVAAHSQRSATNAKLVGASVAHQAVSTLLTASAMDVTVVFNSCSCDMLLDENLPAGGRGC